MLNIIQNDFKTSEITFLDGGTLTIGGIDNIAGIIKVLDGNTDCTWSYVSK